MVGMVAPTDPGGWPDHVSGAWTVSCLDTLPDNGLRYDVLDGTLLVKPSPTPRHQRAILERAVPLRAACPADHEVFVAPLDWQPDGRTSLEPDLLLVHRDLVGERNITRTPTLVVEMLSPGTARIDRMIKFSRYRGRRHRTVLDRGPGSALGSGVRAGRLCVGVIAEGTGDEPISVAEPIAVTVIARSFDRRVTVGV